MSTEPLTIALYATDTMADWEYAYLTSQITVAERAKPGRFTLLLVGNGVDTVHSLGGLPVTPTADLDALDLLADRSALSMLVIPGGETYGHGHDRLIKAVRSLLARNVPVAGICGATYLLARAGVLDERAHTSNSKDFLAASGYTGGSHYVAAPVVTDSGVTTASGIQPVAFTAEVMRVTGLVSNPVADAWEHLHRTGDAEQYGAYVAAANTWAEE